MSISSVTDVPVSVLSIVNIARGTNVKTSAKSRSDVLMSLYQFYKRGWSWRLSLSQ